MVLWSSARQRLPHGGELTEVLRPELVGRGASALMPDHLSRRLSDLAEKIVSEGERGAQQLAGAARSVLGKRRAGFEDEVYFGEEILKSV